MQSSSQSTLFQWLRSEQVSRVYPQDVRFSRYHEAEVKPLSERLRLIYQDPMIELQLEQCLSRLPHSISLSLIERDLGLHCVELSIEQPLSTQERACLCALEGVETFFLPRTLVQLNRPGLLVMDMDSTAIQIECIDELAKLAGVGEEVAKVTLSAMRGELDFEQSLRQRVAKLAQCDAKIIDELCHQLPLMPGLIELVTLLKSQGWRLVLASGGFTPFVQYLQHKLALDAAFANELVIEDGRLTGEITGTLVDANFKASVIDSCSQSWGIAAGQRLALGDGANDIPMILKADFGIAHHGKPKLAQVADANIQGLDLRAVAYLLQLSQL